MRRGQLSLSVIEAAIGVVLVVGVAAGFTVGVAPAPSAEPQLDSLAHDTATLLDSEPAPGGGDAWLVALARSSASFDRLRPDTRERVARALPADVAFRITTPHGTVGYPRPPRTTVGSTSVSTRHGPIRVRVWYG
ncbi:DUF7262 family protein [Haloplanus ruber]|uniref:Type II secretion system protein n=1 Tax=Haloplanus ruber TaxID=869892 RepID=A0ABD6CSY4_9EURY|nr:hypothetical protein [Haloplanus ruber]